MKKCGQSKVGEEQGRNNTNHYMMLHPKLRTREETKL